MFKNMMDGLGPTMDQSSSEGDNQPSQELTREEKQNKLRDKINEKKANR
jgi:hypothetical protein